MGREKGKLTAQSLKKGGRQLVLGGHVDVVQQALEDEETVQE